MWQFGHFVNWFSANCSKAQENSVFGMKGNHIIEGNKYSLLKEPSGWTWVSKRGSPEQGKSSKTWREALSVEHLYSWLSHTTWRNPCQTLEHLSGSHLLMWWLHCVEQESRVGAAYSQGHAALIWVPIAIHTLYMWHVVLNKHGLR